MLGWRCHKIGGGRVCVCTLRLLTLAEEVEEQEDEDQVSHARPLSFGRLQHPCYAASAPTRPWSAAELQASLGLP